MRGYREFSTAPAGSEQNQQYFGYHKNDYRERPDPAFDNAVQEAKSDTARLDATLRRLQKEVEELERERDLQLQHDFKTEELFLQWAGVAVEANDQQCQVTFHSADDHVPTYQIGFQKHGQNWRVAFQNLPYCMTSVPQKVMERKVDSIEKLGLLVHELQVEIDLCNRRAKQFLEAMTLSSPTLRIYPAVNTTSLMLELLVHDSVGTDLKRTSVYLTYLREKYLPEEPVFKFQGGDIKAQLEFKEQLACLKYLPLKEALQSAFSLNEQESEIEQSINNETQPKVLEKSNTPELTAPVKTEQIKSKPGPKPKPNKRIKKVIGPKSKKV